MTERTSRRFAIVGLAAASGALANREAFARALFAGTDPGVPPIGASEPALLRRLALDALADAGEPDRGRIGLVTISATYATDQLAGFLARGLELGGGVRAVAAGALGGVAALDAAASLLLGAPESGVPPCQAVLIAGASGGVEGSALVLMRAEDVGDRPALATIDGWARDRSPSDAAAAALASASVGPGDIGYLRASGGSDAASGLAPAFGPEAATCAIDLARSPATALAAAALGRRRHAAGVLLSGAEEHALVLLGEAGARQARAGEIRLIASTRLVPFTALDGRGLLARLATLEATLHSGADPAAVAREACADSELVVRRDDGATAPLVVALIGRSREDLLSEMAGARRGVPVALERGDEWRTARGSAFAPHPAGRRGESPSSIPARSAPTSAPRAMRSPSSPGRWTTCSTFAPT